MRQMAQRGGARAAILVVVLLLAGVASGAWLALSYLGGPPPVPALLPADTIAYLRLHQPAGLAEQLVQPEAVQHPGPLKQAVGERWQEVIQQLAGEIQLEPRLMNGLLEDTGVLHLALVSLERTEEALFGEMVRRRVEAPVVFAEMTDGRHVEELIEQASHLVKERELHGETVWDLTGWPNSPFEMAWVAGHVIVLGPEAFVVTVIERSRRPSGDSLATVPGFAPLTGEWATEPVVGWVGLKARAGHQVAGLELTLEQARGDERRYLEERLRAARAQAAGVAAGVSFRLGLPGGADLRVYSGDAPFPEALLTGRSTPALTATLPAAALRFALVSDGPSALDALSQQPLVGPSLLEAMEEAEAVLGLDVRTELVPLLGREAAACLAVGPEGKQAVAIFTLKDPQAARLALNRVVRYGRDQGRPWETVTDGQAGLRLRLPLDPAGDALYALIGAQLEVALVGDRLCLGAPSQVALVLAGTGPGMPIAEPGVAGQLEVRPLELMGLADQEVTRPLVEALTAQLPPEAAWKVAWWSEDGVVRVQLDLPLTTLVALLLADPGLQDALEPLVGKL